MMRELDTISPVVWPSWCYSGDGPSESEPAAGAEVKETARTQVTAAVKSRGKKRSHPLMSVRYQRGGETNGEVKPPSEPGGGKVEDKSEAEAKKEAVKTERLSPGGGSVPPGDQNSNSSRSGTPSSSYPGTPPDGGSHIKQMEHMMIARNYSEIMRSLAAKYNHNNPNDYFSSPRNGFPPSLDPRFSAFKAGATPFVGLMAPLGTSAVSPASQPSTTTSSSPSELPKPKPQSDLFTNPFAGANLNPMFTPVIDMSSTQALLSMVRSANAHSHQAQMDSYLKGAGQKRNTESSPLDLSSGAPVSKKIKRELRDSLYSVDSFPLLDVLRTKAKSARKSSSSGSGSSTTACATDSRICSDSEQQSISHWTVDDVCSFITSIDICAEYEKNFRAEQIDGSSLPLLTEEHLTNSLGMKLGPALKLRASLARRLGHCSICLHCVHCHTPSPTTPVPASNSRPSSTGN